MSSSPDHLTSLLALARLRATVARRSPSTSPRRRRRPPLGPGGAIDSGLGPSSSRDTASSGPSGGPTPHVPRRLGSLAARLEAASKAAAASQAAATRAETARVEALAPGGSTQVAAEPRASDAGSTARRIAHRGSAISAAASLTFGDPVHGASTVMSVDWRGCVTGRLVPPARVGIDGVPGPRPGAAAATSPSRRRRRPPISGGVSTLGRTSVPDLLNRAAANTEAPEAPATVPARRSPPKPVPKARATDAPPRRWSKAEAGILRRVWNDLDVNRDGVVSYDELEAFLSRQAAEGGRDGIIETDAIGNGLASLILKAGGSRLQPVRFRELCHLYFNAGLSARPVRVTLPVDWRPCPRRHLCLHNPPTFPVTNVFPQLAFV